MRLSLDALRSAITPRPSPTDGDDDADWLEALALGFASLAPPPRPVAEPSTSTATAGETELGVAKRAGPAPRLAAPTHEAFREGVAAEKAWKAALVSHAQADAPPRELTIALRHPSLGPIALRLRFDGDAVDLTFSAAQPLAAARLSAAVDALRTEVASTGLTVRGVHVLTRSDPAHAVSPVRARRRRGLDLEA